MARAENYPTRPVRIIVGFTLGDDTDFMGRILAQWMALWMSERLGQRFFVDEDQPGAAGNIATEAVVRSPPDGYTLLVVNSVNAINATLYKKLNFDLIRDIAPVASISYEPNVMVVHPSVAAASV